MKNQDNRPGEDVELHQQAGAIAQNNPIQSPEDLKDLSPDELRRMLYELRMSEQSYRSQFTNNAAVMLLIDYTDGSIIDANKVAQQFYGYPREQLLAMRITDINTQPAPETQRNWMSVRPDHGRRFEFQHRLADGSLRYVEVSSSQVLFGERRVLHSIITDITERKRAEKALLESEERYQRITNAITDYIYTVRVVDGRSVETTHGPGCLVVTGYQADEFANDPFLWLRMVAVEDRSKVEEQARRILIDEDPSPIEHRIILKNGTVRWVRNTFIPHRDENGVLLAYDGLIHDITERKQAEEVLQSASRYARNLIETSLDPLVMISTEGKITDVNAATEKITGLSRERLIGTDFVNYFTEPEMARTGYLKVFELGQVTDYPLAVRHDSGTITDVLYNASVYRDEQGEVLGVFAAARDITKRKRAEEALRQALDQIKTLRGIVPICMICKKIRDDQGYWSQVEVYVHNHTEAEFSHGLCPECSKKIYPDLEEDDGFGPQSMEGTQ